jgi:hypothetical protein
MLLLTEARRGSGRRAKVEAVGDDADRRDAGKAKELGDVEVGRRRAPEPMASYIATAAVMNSAVCRQSVVELARPTVRAPGCGDIGGRCLSAAWALPMSLRGDPDAGRLAPGGDVIGWFGVPITGEEIGCRVARGAGTTVVSRQGCPALARSGAGAAAACHAGSPSRSETTG